MYQESGGGGIEDSLDICCSFVPIGLLMYLEEEIWYNNLMKEWISHRIGELKFTFKWEWKQTEKKQKLPLSIFFIWAATSHGTYLGWIFWPQSI